MFKDTFQGDRNFFRSATTFFKITGLWRTDHRTKWMEPYVYISRFNVFFFFGWAFIFSVQCGCYLYYLDGETDKALDWATFSLAYVTFQGKFVLLMTNEMRIRKIIKKLEMFSSKYPNKKFVQNSLRVSERLAVIGSLLVSSACIAYCTYPIAFNYRKVLPINTMFTFGLNIFESPIYEFYYVYQILGTLCNSVIAMTFDMTYVGFLLTYAAVLRNLNIEMKRKLTRRFLKPEEMFKELITNVKEHIEIVDSLNEVRELFAWTNMLHFLYNYFTAGLTMFQASNQPIGSVRFFSMISGYSSVVFGLVTYCESGQKVSDEMHIFWQNLFLTDWYEQPINFRKTIAFALQGTQKDYYLVAGKTMTLSRETEKNIIQAVFTYFTFLVQLST